MTDHYHQQCRKRVPASAILSPIGNAEESLTRDTTLTHANVTYHTALHILDCTQVNSIVAAVATAAGLVALAHRPQTAVVGDNGTDLHIGQEGGTYT